ncbi:septal junction protein FraD [Chlorogloeopsis sp. ULAP02]|uniref:septal junction protein FraD n=1 Tax=Chlorogloeopsis sp. ULAP02 TaxID=3107926 RepID=UPI003134C631
MQLIKDAFGLFNLFGDVYERIRKILIPPKAYSWQTLIYLSIFSLLMSSLSSGLVRDIIAFCGWLFLIAGTAWYTTDNPLLIPGTNMPVGALITGFLVSAFAFRQQEDVITTNTIVFWPTISALITAIPEFFEGTGTDVNPQIPKLEDRQKIIILIASSMVLSCCLQFTFVVNKWYQEYPSLKKDNFQRTFVVKLVPSSETSQNGAIILDKLEPRIEQQIAERPWSEVEQWLLEARQRVGNLGRQVIEANLREYEERSLWRVEPRIYNLKSGYKLDLFSIWSGPSSAGRGYYLRKTCRIEPIAKSNNTFVRSRTDDKSVIAEFDCDPVSKPILEPPPDLQ